MVLGFEFSAGLAMGSVLIVDDEPAICWTLREALRDEGHQVQVAPSAEEALRLTAGNPAAFVPDAVLLDVRLPGRDGLEALDDLRQNIGAVPVIIMTAFGDLQTAVNAVEHGVYDYLLKPFDLDPALAIVNRALQPPVSDSTEGAAGTALPPSSAGETIIGRSLAMQQVFKNIALAAASEISVLITGESGTGKELVARALHRHSPRRDADFLPVCIPALNPGVIESELFGHVRGAFTGAAEDRIGLLELARAGTVFLDEVGDIPLHLQVKLLRAIEQGEITRVGEARARPAKPRLLTATNRPISELIAQGQFREDLYFRLSVFHIHLPPLRERPEDIPLLAEHFVQQTQAARGGHPVTLSEAALRELARRTWPGNVRELRNAVEHAALVSRGGMIHPEHLPRPLAAARVEHANLLDTVQAALRKWVAQAARENTDPSPEFYAEFLHLVEPPLLEVVLEHVAQNKAAAAQLLGLHRATLRQKLRRYGLPRPE